MLDRCTLDPVPVVVVFTKMDGLDFQSYGNLLEQHMSDAEAIERAPGYSLSIAKEEYAELAKMAHPPKSSVFLRNMHQGNSTCEELIRATVAVLDDSNLQLLLVSTQQVSMEICIEYALKSWVKMIAASREKKIRGDLSAGNERLIWQWFPHIKEHYYDHDDYHLHHDLLEELLLEGVSWFYFVDSQLTMMAVLES